MADVVSLPSPPLTALELAAGVGAAILRAAAEGKEVTRSAAEAGAGLARAVEAQRQRRALALLEGPADQQPASFAAFHNRLRIMLALDRHELVAAGALDNDDLCGWVSFRTDPFRHFIKADDASAAALWKLIQERETR